MEAKGSRAGDVLQGQVHSPFLLWVGVTVREHLLLRRKTKALGDMLEQYIQDLSDLLCADTSSCWSC